MEWDVCVNPDKFDNIIETLSNETAILTNLRIEIFNLITNMDQHAWKGKAYEAFRDSCLKYQPALEELEDLLGGFQELFTQTQTDANKLITDVENAWN